MKISLSWILMVVTVCHTYGQNDLEFGENGTTSTISHTPTYTGKGRQYKKKRLIQIIKKDTQWILYGNKCMSEVTTAMGFEFIIQPKGRPGNRSELGRLTHNFFSKMGITLRNGPFWKLKLNRKRNECRQSTGDFTG